MTTKLHMFLKHKNISSVASLRCIVAFNKIYFQIYYKSVPQKPALRIGETKFETYYALAKLY